MTTGKKASDASHLSFVQNPAERVGFQADVAVMIAFLISPQAGFVTGQNFLVDGGMTRKMIYAD